MSNLAALFAELDATLRIKVEAVFESLAKPATAAKLAKLAPLFGGTVPASVRAWFLWHDGQKESAFESIIPDTNWSAMSIASVRSTHADLTAGAKFDDIMKPWKPTWIPLFENGGGDNLCYDTETGAIVTWYHDDARRPKHAASFDALIEKIAAGYRKLKKRDGIAPPPKRVMWRKSSRPRTATLAAMPIGTAISFTLKRRSGAPYLVFVKRETDRWLECLGTSRTDAVKMWRQYATRPPADIGTYCQSDSSVASSAGGAKDFVIASSTD